MLRGVFRTLRVTEEASDFSDVSGGVGGLSGECMGYV